MSLQDDIARYLEARYTYPEFDGYKPSEAVAAGLNLDYYLVKLADLQPVDIRDGHYSIAGVKLQRTDRDLGVLKIDCEYAISVYEYAKSRESEAATLARRRDELARELSPVGTDYDHISRTAQIAIDRIIELEGERS